jgi:hypothetical protein
MLNNLDLARGNGVRSITRFFGPIRQIEKLSDVVDGETKISGMSYES